MKKRAYLLFALVFSGIVFAGTVSPPIQHPTINQTCHCSANNGTPIVAVENGAEERIARYTGWLTGATIALAIVAAFQLFLIIKGDKITRMAAEAAKRSADVSEKALIDVESPALYPVINDGHALWAALHEIKHSGQSMNIMPIKIAIKNFGRTPGFPGSISCSLYIGEADDVVDDVAAGFHSDSLLGPGDISTTIATRSIGRPMGPQDCTQILSGGYSIYLKGHIQFMDMFGIQYLQTFCMKWSPISQQFVAWGPTRNQRERIKDGKKN
jgi:hypothetical protein